MNKRDWNAEQNMRMEAEEMAQRIAAQSGWEDPRLTIGATFDDITTYDRKMAEVYRECLKKLDQRRRESKNTEMSGQAKPTWQDKAYD